MIRNIKDELINNKIGLIVIFFILFTPLINYMNANINSLSVNYSGPLIFTTIAYFIITLFIFSLSKIFKYKFVVLAASTSLLYLLLMIYEPILQIGLKFISLKYITYTTLFFILLLSSISLILFKSKFFIQTYIVFTIALFFVAILGFFISYINQIDEKNIVRKVANDNIPIAVNVINKPEQLRNIYYIITDGLGSQKGLISGGISTKEINEFKKTLEDNNFYIAEKSTSSYNSTYLSVQSIFEMDYPILPNSKKYNVENNFFPGSLSIDKPKTFLHSTLLNNGYDKLYWSGSRASLRCKDKASNLDCIKLKAKNFNEVVASMLQDNSTMIYLEQSIFPRILQKISAGNYDSIDGALSHLSNDNIIKDNSLFFFIHEMMPHPPYVTRNCEPIFGTGNVYVGPNHRDYYNSSIACLNKKIQKFIKFIDEKDKEAIIVIQGDHGSKFKKIKTNKFIDLSKEYFNERFSNFNAFRLPKDCEQHLYDSIGTVNSIRLVVACASGVKPKFTEDKNYFSAYKIMMDSYGKVVDVTDIVK